MTRIPPLIRPVSRPAADAPVEAPGRLRGVAAAGSRSRPARPTGRTIAFGLVLGAALVVRLWNWPGLPAGLDQDEISSGYEAWSLLLTGADRWGARWPAYFLSWGSGQNVLYSYLTIPFVALLGPVPAAVRIVQLVAGLASVLLSHRVAESARRGAGIWAMLAVAVCPWQVLLSRWGLESNLLPAVALAGLVTLQRALAPEARTRVIVVALVPLALALYAYGISIVPLAVFVVLVAVRHRRALFARRGSWAAALALAAVVATPFLLFLLKTFVLKRPLPLEQLLPFSLPTLTDSRLAQVSASSSGSPLRANLGFVFNGFGDGWAWNGVPGHAPLPTVLVALGFAELCLVVVRAVRQRSSSPFTLVDLFTVAAMSLLVVMPLNLNQANLLAMALVLSAGKALARLVAAARDARRTVAAIAAGVVILPGALAFADYVGPGYAAATYSAFNPGLDDALHRAAGIAPAEPVWVTPTVNLNYIQTLWYLRIPPQGFRASSPSPTSPDFGRFHFLQADLSGLPRFAFVVRSGDPSPCADPVRTTDGDGFRTGFCAPR